MSEPKQGNNNRAEPPSGRPSQAEIDLKALAEKIYKLLKEEARIERERRGRSRIG
jgi:hypothetical protein